MAIERELKYRLEPQHYTKLLRSVSRHGVKKKRLTNVYFDTPELDLRKKRIGFRVRISEGRRAEVTVKIPARGAAIPGFKARHEHECPVRIADARKILQGTSDVTELNCEPIRFLQKIIARKHLGRIILLGEMRTLRTVAPLGRGLKMEIDKSEFLGKTFYELEVESENPALADRMVREMLEALKIPCEPSDVSKLGRFLDEWTRRSSRGSGKTRMGPGTRRNRKP